MNVYDQTNACAQSTIGGRTYNPSPANQTLDVNTRFFDDLGSDIAIAREATNAGLDQLMSLAQRLGVPSMYGSAKLAGEVAPSAGRLDDIRREMYGLIETQRELRGLAETLAARL